MVSAMFEVCIGTCIAETLKQAEGHAWNQECLPGGGAQYKEGERILLFGEEAAAGLDAEIGIQLSQEDRRGKGAGGRCQGR